MKGAGIDFQRRMLRQMIIDCTSDFHGNHPDLEGGDLLIIAGDITSNDQPSEYLKFFVWLDNLDYKRKILIGGNHDTILEKHPPTYGNWDYLFDSGIEIEGLKIWGSPWTKKFSGVNPECTAFMINKNLMRSKWDLIPKDTDVLITHGPPWGMLDKTVRGQKAGCMDLLDAVVYIRPKLHVFGHIHEAYGQIDVQGTTFVNCSYVNEKYAPVNSPVRVIL